MHSAGLLTQGVADICKTFVYTESENRIFLPEQVEYLQPTTMN